MDLFDSLAKNPLATSPLPPATAAAPPGGIDLTALAKAIAAELAQHHQAQAANPAELINPLLDRAQNRAEQDWQRKYAGEMGSLSDTQRYYVMSAPPGEMRMQRLATAAMVNRHAAAREAGVDQDMKFRPQLPNETRDQYMQAMQAQSSADAARRAAVRDKLQAQTDQAKATAAQHAAAGQAPFSRAILATPNDTRSIPQRALTAQQIVQGQRAPLDDNELRDAQSVIASGGRGPLPAVGNTYTGAIQYGSGPIKTTAAHDDEAGADTALDAISDNDEDDRLAAIRKALQANPQAWAAASGAPLIGG